MSIRIESHRLQAVVALCMIAGLSPVAHAADAQDQRVAMACTQAKHCNAQSSVSPMTSHVTEHRAETAPVKKAAKVTKPAAVDYERDLWRHQSAS